MVRPAVRLCAARRGRLHYSVRAAGLAEHWREKCGPKPGTRMRCSYLNITHAAIRH